jgi:hypothetical protein
LLDNEIPILSNFFPKLDLIKFSKVKEDEIGQPNLTKNSKIKNSNSIPTPICKSESSNRDVHPTNTLGCHLKPGNALAVDTNHKFYIETEGKNNRRSYRRAGGLAWLRYRLDMAGVVGSNPTRPIQKLNRFHPYY